MSDGKPAPDDACAGCLHAIARHYTDPSGTIRCLWSERGTSRAGVIGIPYERYCDCANYVSVETTARHERETKKRDEDRERMKAWAAEHLPNAKEMERAFTKEEKREQRNAARRQKRKARR